MINDLYDPSEIKTPREVIERAIGIFRDYGWCRNDFAQCEPFPNGEYPRAAGSIFDKDICSFCMTGALHRAAQVEAHEIWENEAVYFEHESELGGPEWPTKDEKRRYGLVNRAMECISDTLSWVDEDGHHASKGCCSAWNDDFAKSKEQVIKVLQLTLDEEMDSE